ncbi:hypothetical protein BDR03DRAFT_925514 [Suillus americanus]|nr:hypothetical protein BDR03DRAFT_925514 [Suillus americanus]
MEMHHYMVWAQDYTDEGALARRMAVRPKHLLGAKKLVIQGVIKVAGGFLTSESQREELHDRKFVGSALIYEAESLEDARSWKEGVVGDACSKWDKAKLIILLMVIATTLDERAVSLK